MPDFPGGTPVFTESVKQALVPAYRRAFRGRLRDGEFRGRMNSDRMTLADHDLVSRLAFKGIFFSRFLIAPIPA
jgi:hypothetical protein